MLGETKGREGEGERGERGERGGKGRWKAKKEGRQQQHPPPLPLTIAPFRVIDREAKEIESAIADLQRQKSEAEKTMLSLRRTFLELEEDVKCKKNTLNVDNS